MSPISTFVHLNLRHPSPFLHGYLPKIPPISSPSPHPASPSALTVRAMKTLQDRVVCATNAKTVAVEVIRLAPHPKYKHRIRKKKKYQAHGPENQFKVGSSDYVQLEKSRTISKTKTFVAITVTARNAPRSVQSVPLDLDLPPPKSQDQG